LSAHGKAADLFACAIVLFQMANGGRKPFNTTADYKYAMIKQNSTSFWVSHSKGNQGYNPILSNELMNLIQTMM
jgi:hypothetical protein